jgi:hypothetical protein
MIFVPFIVSVSLHIGAGAHCKDTLPKIRNKYSQKRNCISPTFHIHVSVSDLCIFPRSVWLYSAAGKYADRSWEYINRSQTLECRNWNWTHAQFLFREYITGIFVAVRCFRVILPTLRQRELAMRPLRRRQEIFCFLHVRQETMRHLLIRGVNKPLNILANLKKCWNIFLMMAADWLPWSTWLRFPEFWRVKPTYLLTVSFLQHIGNKIILRKEIQTSKKPEEKSRRDLLRLTLYYWRYFTSV